LGRFEYRQDVGLIDYGAEGGSNILVPESSNLSDRVCFCGTRLRYFDLPEGKVMRCISCGHTIPVDSLRPNSKLRASWDDGVMLIQPGDSVTDSDIPEGAQLISEETVC
jgi:hypothetical protein